ncbi:MAG: chromosome partitioning protein ParA [Planctomycetes bacterium RBG_13_63_9]|nr:MAG: chromosome partitioning protein ParA [Planctomycetes bacterium RBG_13_63_9]
MRSIAVMNQKGGVAKTTTVVNLGAALAEMAMRVCLIDLDPQAHATLHLGIDPRPDRPSVYDVLTSGLPVGEVRQQVAENLWVVGSSLDLAGAEIELAEVAGREGILRARLREDDFRFDYLLIDCPPSLGILTLNALVAAGEVFIPLQPHFLALHGLSKLLETIELVAERMNSALTLGGVIFCMYDSGTRLAAEVSEDVAAFFRGGRDRPTPWAAAHVLETRVRRNIRLAEAPSFGQSILQYAPSSHGAEDYRRLAQEIVAGQPAIANGKSGSTDSQCKTLHL